MSSMQFGALENAMKSVASIIGIDAFKTNRRRVSSRMWACYQTLFKVCKAWHMTFSTFLMCQLLHSCFPLIVKRMYYIKFILAEIIYIGAELYLWSTRSSKSMQKLYSMCIHSASVLLKSQHETLSPSIHIASTTNTHTIHISCLQCGCGCVVKVSTWRW